MKMIKGLLAATTVLTASTLGGIAAQANPIWLGYSLNGSAITEIGNSGNNGTASTNGTFQIAPGIAIQLQGTGAPFTSEGTLLSNSLAISASTAANLILYVSETNNNGRAAFFTTGFSNDSSSTAPITLSSYISSGNTRFSMDNLLATATVAPGAAMNSITTARPSSVTSPYTITSTYGVTFGANGGQVNSTLNVTSAIPEPATWAMMLVGFGMVGAASRYRRRGTKVTYA